MSQKYINFLKSFLRGAFILAFFLVNTQFAFATTWTLDADFDHRYADNFYDNFETNRNIANSAVSATVIQSDGKIVAAGSFTTYDDATQNRIMRFNTDGSVDETFSTGTGFNSTVSALALESDGDIIAVGSFSTYNGTTSTRIARIDSNGTLDTTFATNIGTSSGGTAVSAVTVQSDGDILIGGAFNAFNGTSVGGIARLNSDGTIDSSFATATGTGFDYADDGSYSYTVTSLALQSDGDIVVGGVFNTFNGTSTTAAIARLNSDGTLDTTFSTNVGSNLCASGNSGTDFTEVAIQSDGKILLQTAQYNYQVYLDDIPSPCSTPSNVVTLGTLMRFNSDGTYDTDFVASGEASALVIQSDGKILSGGTTGLSRFNTDGSADATLSVGTDFNSSVGSLALESDGDIIVGGAFTSYNGTAVPLKRLARISSTGTLDTTFGEQATNPYLDDTGFDSVGNNSILSMAIQSDGKIVVGGIFTTYNATTQNRIARLNTDGTLDETFSIGTGFSSGQVNDIAIQSDGDIVVGGTFTSYNGTSANRIIRLNSDGSVDSTFVTNIGTGANTTVSAIALQSDGKILVGGAFTTFNSVSTSLVVRLNTDGTKDTDYSGSTFAGGIGTRSVNDIIVQTDGKIILGGAIFQTYGGVNRNKILRVESNGALDTSFTPGTGLGTTSVQINGMAIQADGEIVIGGTFTTYNGTSSSRLARINTDGTLDTTFTTNMGTGPNTTVSKIAIDDDGYIYITGSFTTFNSVSRDSFARVTSTGTLDTDLEINGGFDFVVASTNFSALTTVVAVQSDDKVIIGGVFGQYDSNESAHLVRIEGPDATAPVLTETTVVSTPTTDTTPSYTFTTDEAGTISYGGSCTSATTSATVGANTITFTALAVGTYSDCTITVTDASSNASSALTVSAFTIQAESSGSNTVSSGSSPSRPEPEPDPVFVPPVVDVPEFIPPVNIPVSITEIPSFFEPPLIEEVEEVAIPSDPEPISTPEEQNNIVTNNAEPSSSQGSGPERKSILELVAGLFKDARLSLSQDKAQNILNIVSSVALATGLAGMLNSIPRLWNLLPSLFGLRKRHLPWGTVYDAITKQPLDPAYVTLMTSDGKEIQNSITDLDGRYGFLVTPGTYKLKSGKTHYVFPSQELSGKTEDELYADLYFGESITIEQQGEVIARNIPMDPIGFDWNEEAKKNIKIAGFFEKHDVMLVRIINVLFYLGVVTSIIALSVLTNIFNIVIFCLYLLMILLRAFGFKPRGHGVVTDKQGYPLPYAIIRIFQANLDKEISHKVTDKHGKYYCLVAKGDYYITIEKKEGDGYREVFRSPRINLDGGILNKNFITTI